MLISYQPFFVPLIELVGRTKILNQSVNANMASNISGIVGEGEERFIPGSRRPDGTLRKERKVRPGFTPAEDVVRYSNSRMEASKPSLYPPGYTPKAKTDSGTGKNQKKADRKTDSVASDAHDSKPVPVPAAAATTTASTSGTATAGAATETEKKIKGLEKKLRQINDLKAKQRSGEPLNSDQLDKISKAKSLEDQLSQLKI